MPIEAPCCYPLDYQHLCKMPHITVQYMAFQAAKGHKTQRKTCPFAKRLLAPRYTLGEPWPFQRTHRT